MRVTSSIVGGMLLSCICAASCGGAGGAAEAVRPKDMTYAQASNANEPSSCSNGPPSEALIVDWRPEQRGDLEVAMKEGIAIVKYDCHTIQLLTNCSVQGTYGFIGITRKEQLIVRPA